MEINGTLNVYFPCEVNADDISKTKRRWNARRQRQQAYVKRHKLPSTELYDNAIFREELECILEQFWNKHFDNSDSTYSPFATEGIKKSYYGMREDSLFSKNVSAQISPIHLAFQNLYGYYLQIRGNVLLNINIENGLGTIIVALALDGMQPEDVYQLKHAFYKRLYIVDNSNRQSVQEFVCGLLATKLKQLKIANVDFRARYTFLELYDADDFYDNKEVYYGLLNADESNISTKKKSLTCIFNNNLFHRETRGYYVSKTNALVLHNLIQKRHRDGFTITENLTEDKRNRLKECCQNYIPPHHISIRDEKYYYTKDHFNCPVAGTKNNLFPEFLRAVELHYMLDKVTTSEISDQKKSAINPVIFIPRSYKLWTIIYEKAVNKYHINEDLMEAFSINANLEMVNSEYKSIQQLIINFTMILISLFSLLTTIASFFK